MLFGFGKHGLSSQALQLYNDMVAHGMKPDKVTFIGLFMTCSRAGLIDKGRLFFDLIFSVYGLTYEIDHVACMVDKFGQGGYLAEATELASKYSEKATVEAKSSSYEALLGACSIHGNIRMGGQWKEAEIVRKAMVVQGVKKMPGYSWIKVKNRVTVFVAGNISHPYMEELCKILNSLLNWK
ncbi:hypothetical protein CRYUN_Cryun40dG0020300 [Craigia yunnanensis]